MSDATCIHGNDIDGDCSEPCEHGVACGAECKECDDLYMDMIRRLCVRLGNGDAEKGRRYLSSRIEFMGFLGNIGL